MKTLSAARFRHSLPILALLLLSGCSQIMYRPATWVASDFAQNHLIPDMMNSDRLDSGCALSLAGQPVFDSLEQINSMPVEISVMLDLSNGFCLQQKAWEKQLEVSRFQKAGRLSDARDSRIAAQRLWSTAATRLYGAWQRFAASEMAQMPQGQCQLSQQQQLGWLMGITAGMQAVYSDTQAASGMNVPRETVVKAWRRLPCLDNQRWWGIPMAMQASIEIMLPHLKQGDITGSRETLESALQQGEQQGLHLAHLLAMQIELNQQNQNAVKDLIRRFADSDSQQQPDQGMLFQTMARLQIQAISDQIWTEETGYRTPLGQLGHFATDQPEAKETVDIDDLLQE